MLGCLVETEVRRLSEERKLADSEVVFEGPADESANERMFKDCTMDVLRIYSFYAKGDTSFLGE